MTDENKREPKGNPPSDSQIHLYAEMMRAERASGSPADIRPFAVSPVTPANPANLHMKGLVSVSIHDPETEDDVDYGSIAVPSFVVTEAIHQKVMISGNSDSLTITLGNLTLQLHVSED